MERHGSRSVIILKSGSPCRYWLTCSHVQTTPRASPSCLLYRLSTSERERLTKVVFHQYAAKTCWTCVEINDVALLATQKAMLLYWQDTSYVDLLATQNISNHFWSYVLLTSRWCSLSEVSVPHRQSSVSCGKGFSSWLLRDRSHGQIDVSFELNIIQLAKTLWEVRCLFSQLEMVLLTMFTIPNS